MPIRVHLVKVGELHETIKGFMDKGYRCLPDSDGDWECSKPVNEIVTDLHLIVLKTDKPQVLT